jgi:multiple sugar transport system permease protein
MLARRRLSVGVRMLLALLLVVLSGFPIYWMYNTATTDPSDLFQGEQSLLPRVDRTAHIFSVFATDTPLLRWLGNSAVIAFGTTFLSLALAVLAAYALSRYRFHGSGVFGFALFATQMLPEALLVVPLYSLFTALGLLNDLGGLVLADTAFAMPVAVWILKSAMDAVPYEVEESARVDGCPAFGILSLIIFPLVMPSVAAAAVIAFFDGWNEYLFATTFIQDRDSWAASTGLAAFVGEFSTPLDIVFSAALLFTLPAIVFFLLVQRRIVSGLTAGAVKG